MNSQTYRDYSKTAEGRHEVHGIMLNEIAAKCDALVAGAPEANRAKAREMMDNFTAKAQGLGNGVLFDYFAAEGVSMKNFVRYMMDVLAGKIC